MEDQESQEDELLALASIYDSDVFVCDHEETPPCGSFTVHLQIPQPFSVVFTQEGTRDSAFEIKFASLSVL